MIKIKRPLVLKWVAVFVTVVAALDEFCRIDSDCPEGRCYLEGYEENATGFCMCDEATNSGCNASKGQTCERTNFGGSFQGGPSGLHTSCIVPMDAECSDDKECEGICFVPNNNHIMTGTCKCQADWNVGCPHILEIECTDADVASGGVPRCAKRLGKACLEDFECGSRNCFEGICRCNFTQDAEFWYSGCSNGTHVYTGGNFSELDLPAGVNLTVPKGARCFGDCQCETRHCERYYNNYDPHRKSGVCACQRKTNAGCAEGYTCTDVIGGDIGVELDCYLAVGSECPGQMPCLTGNCVDGICNCLPSRDFHNYGCAEGLYCISNDTNSQGYLGAAHCDAKLPLGSNCTMAECDNCFEGTCACRPLSRDSGCPAGESCLGSSSDRRWRGPFQCGARSPIGSLCESFSDCETGVCYGGKCQCNPEVNSETDGFCSNGQYCSGTWNYYDGWHPPFRCEDRIPAGSVCGERDGCVGGAPCIDGVCQKEDYRSSSCLDELITSPWNLSTPQNRTPESPGESI